MNFSIMTASLPIDEETFEEIKALCDEALGADGCQHSNALNLYMTRNPSSRGFSVLAYDDEKNALIGVANAIDKMGLNTYEWAILISPMYRNFGIDDAMMKVLNDGLRQRGAEGELVLLMENDKYGRNLIERYDYSYCFSEATYKAIPEVMQPKKEINIRHFKEASDMEVLIGIFQEAFGDLRDESIELISYNSTAQDTILWVAEYDGEIAGTVTSAKKGEVQWISALAVHSKLQGQGIGTALLNWVKDFALRNGEKLVMLDVEIENENALAVYEKAGFTKSMQVDYFVYGD